MSFVVGKYLNSLFQAKEGGRKNAKGANVLAALAFFFLFCFACLP